MKGWKTILFNAAGLAVAVSEILPPKYALYVALIGNGLLRFFTTTPIGKGE